MTSNKQRRIERVYPLSPMQSGMLFHALQNEYSRAYFEQMTFRLKGDINKDLLQQSFDIIFARYDILRTIFRADKLEEPLQFVLKERNFRLHFEDISHLSETEKNTYLQEFVEKDKEKGFDLTRDILMRVTLFKMGADAYALVWSFHHILMDGWCLGIIYNELNRIYRSLKTGRPIELEPVTPYVNYINWLEQQDIEKGLEYWENYLEGYEQQAGLPKLKPADQLYQLEEYDMVIDKKEARTLNTIARKNQVTVNTVFQTLWGILLQKYTNSNDVVFGAVVSGRPPEIKGIEIMVGLFLNTIPTRIKSREEDNVVQLLTKVQEETARSKNYEYLLLADIQSKTALKGSLIDHIMAFENLPVQQEIKAASGEKGPKPDILFGIQDIKQYNQTNYDFNIIIIPQVPFVVKFNYNSRIYEKEFIHRVGLHLKEIIKQVLDNPDTAMKEIEIITEEERQQVLFDFNQTAAEYPKGKTIHALFEEQAARTPGHTAVNAVELRAESVEQLQITYYKLNEKSNQLAHLLREKGVGKDTVVGIMMERSVDMIIGMLGILKAGGAYLPIDPDYPEERINYMLNDSSAEILLTSYDLSNNQLSIVNYQLSMNSQPAASLAYIIYTSGTTGKPKGVMIEHGNVVRLMVNNRFQFDFNDCDVWTLFHSFCFDFSVWEMYGALLYGGKLIIIPKMAARDTGKYLEILKNQQVTVLNQTPSAFYALVNLELRNSNKDLNLKYVIFGGEALSPGKLKEWKAKYPGTKLINMYGITETTVHVTFKEIENSEIESNVSNIGEPIPTLSTYVLDKHLNVQPIGIAGELYVGGEGVGRGYLNRPELTAKKFIKFHHSSLIIQRLYRSGDLARWLPGGELEYLGRIDHQVKIRGFRIELGEIESRLSGYKGIEEAVVLSKEDEKGDKCLCAYFVSGNKISIPGLRENLSGYLPEYMVPSYFIQLEKIPLTSNGKLDRKALPEPGFKAGEDYTAPRNEVEKKLVEIWSEVLGIEKEIIGIDHSFFELGGHSLKAAILISKVHKALDVKLPLAELFIKPSIRELTPYIKSGEKESYVSIEAVEDKEYYPVSSAQKRLYLLKTMDPGSTAYNSYAVFTLEGGLEKSIIEETFRKLIHQHESLRTSFHMVNGEPVQRVHKEVDFGIEYYDLAAKNAKEREDESLIQDFIQPFDLAKVPLLRVGLSKTSRDEHIFMVDMHHIVTDGTSMGLLIDDFMSLYRGEELPGFRIQYNDYSQWQKSLMGSEIMKHQESYWLNQFTEEIPVLNLPTDYPRPVNLTFEGNMLTFILGKNETGQLKALALEEGASLFMLLLAVFNVFLAKVTRQERIVVGTPTAGRRHTDLEKIIGMFVNTLPLSNEPNGEKTFREFLKELKERTLEAFENQDFQFEDLVDKVVKDRDTNRNPLFDVMFALQNVEVANLEKTGLRLKPYPFERATSLFDLTLQGTETGENILFSVEYCTKLFKKETVERLVSYFNKVIALVLEDRERKISGIEIITDEERKQVLFDFNDTKTDYPADKTIHELFAQQVERVPDRIAVTGPAYGVGTHIEGRFTGAGDLSLTYREVNERANRLCHRLRQKGVGPDMNPIVGIMMGRFVDIIVGIIGILKAGGAYLPIDPEYPQDRIKYMLAEGNVKVLVSELNKVSEGIDVVKPSELSEAPLSHLTHPTYSTQPCYVLYTSGSTGRPKGVVVEHRNAVRLVKNTNYMEFQENDHILQTGAIEFDASTFEICGTLLNGLSLYLVRKEDMLSHGKFKEMIRKYDITVMCISTALFSQLASIDSGIFAGLEWLLVGGEVMSPVHANVVKCRFPGLKFVNGYGPTENTTYSATFLIDREYTENIPIGKPIANSTVFIVDKYDHLTPIGVPGEMYVGGDGVARGYLNNPELTSENFVDLEQASLFSTPHSPTHPLTHSTIYKTGDLARWLPDGNIQFLGRIDHQVKIRGFRIELGEIESHLLQHEKIKETVVVARKGEDGNKYLCAYWLPALPAGETGLNLTFSELKEFLSGKLAPYMIPSYFIQLQELPMTATGKIDRKLLPAPDISNITLDSTYVAPKDDMETLIADTWKDVLNLDRVGVRDNFFDLGGNSLKIIQVNEKISKALGVKIQVVNLFKYPTITELKKYLQHLKNGIDVQLPGVGEEDQRSRPGTEIPVNTDIAVIGMAGRFPGAGNIHRFWENLKNGIESISFFSSEELKESGVSSQLLENPDFVKARAMVEDKDQFDAAFFNYTPREARVMDPQMRVFHECVWEALEDAGYNPDTYNKPIGLYAGASKNIVWELRVNVLDQAAVMDIFESNQLTDSHFIPTRISYRLNLKGPAMFIHTACSTSLTAIHTACNALLVGDCTMALAGGVNLLPEKASGYLYQEGLVMSPDGHCRAFDGGANGTVGGEGTAVVLLKPLEQALEDRDHIYAVVKAAAANNDGARKVGFSAPSIDGQAEAIAGVYRKAGVPPESITYIETHGTGTMLGDPIELEALKQAFNTQKRGFCALGSVKTNVGHTDTAAGAVSLIKVVLALTHKQIPPSLHFEIPNLQVDLADSPFYINAELSEWEPGPYPLRAGVSSFGIGGTNAHVVLEEWPEFRRSDGHTVDHPCLMLLTAKTPTALDKIRENLANYLKESLSDPTNPVNPGLTLADAAYTLQVGRKTFNHRWMTVCSSVDEAVEALTSPGGGEMHVCVPEEGNDIPLTVEPAVDKPALTRIGQLWLHGQEIDWQDFYPGEKRRRVPLPTYPFEGQRYWIEGNLFKMENLQPVSREVKPTKNKDIADWFYFPRWLSSTLIPSQENTGEALCFLLFIDEYPLVKQLAARLRSRGTGEDHRVITVEQGDAFKRKGDDEYVIDPHSSDDYHRLFTELNQMGRFPNRVVHSWNVTDNDSDYQPGISTVGPGFYSLLYLSRAIGNQDFGGEIRIDVVTTNIQEVTGNETLIPEKAVVLGPLKVIPQEYPYIICRCIDIELPAKGSPQEDILAGCLVNEFLLGLDSPDTDIAYRSHYRWIKTYEPVRLEARETEQLILKDRGIYLITGGSGNIGFTLAEYLVKHFRARLILTGATPLPAREEWDRWLSNHINDTYDRFSRKIAKIRQLEAAGGEVLALAADAGDKEAMENVIRTAEETFGPINGVIHAAGVIKGKSVLCPLEEVGENECNRQFHPKITGTLVLAQLFQDKPLDFCLLTASLSPILGGLGFFAYSAANAFMDVFAHLTNRSGPVRWISVDWADWGFDRDVDAYSSSSLGASALEMMITPDEGVETFKRILTLVQTPTRQVVVSSGDLQARIDQWVKLRSLRKDDSHETAEESLYQLQERPNLSSRYTSPRTSMEKDIANIWQHQFGFEKIGVHDDFFELGGDSLKAISMISRIHKELNARVQLNEFFTRPTIEALSHYITDAEKGSYVSIPPLEKREYYELSSAPEAIICTGSNGDPGHQL